MKKNLEHYLSLIYTIRLQKISQEDGGGWYACIPELGEDTFIGDGETPDEAVTDLNLVKEELFEDFLKEGKPIPEPKKIEDEKYSGKFVIRIPKDLHKDLSKRAYENNVSLNHYVLHLLSYNKPINDIQQSLDNIIKHIYGFSKTIQTPREHVSHQFICGKGLRTTQKQKSEQTIIRKQEYKKAS